MAERKTRSKAKTTLKASFILRLAAFIIDLVILGIVDRVFSSLYLGLGPTMRAGRELAYRNGLWPMLIMWGYLVFMDVKYGATIGKMVLKLRVVSAKTGAFLTWQEALLREVVGRFVNGLTLGIGYLWVLWDKDSQGIHDKIAGSYVVKE